MRVEYMKKSLPYVIAVGGLVLYTWFIAPWVADIRDDWAFLHAARTFAVQQAQQKAQAPK